MRTCPNCSASVAADARFCASCGIALSLGCLACGFSLPEDARFCPNCGTPLTRDEPIVTEERPEERPEERKVVTVLFADVTGSTAIGEGLDPERLRAVLDTYFTAMRGEIEAQGGTVEKFIGDAIVAVFGVPTAHEDDPARAIRAARRMLDRLDVVNETLATEHGLRLQIRIGVNTGAVLASTDPQPGEPMVTGDAVNTAARLQTAAEPGGVLVGDRTARAVRGFRFGEETTLRLKGKAEPVVALVLLGGTDAVERGVPGLQAPIVGRDRELDLLRTLFERAVDERRPHLVTIYGDPGVGKSRLTREFLAWATERDVAPTVVIGRCLPYGDGITYWPLAEILKSRAGIRDSDSPEEVLMRLDELHALAPDTIDAVRMRAGLAATLGVEDPRRPAVREPKQVRTELHEAWRWFLSALAAHAPTLVVVEDVHWADTALLDLLEELGERTEGPAMFVCPARPELTDRRPSWGGGRRQASSISLDPLDRTEADQLVRLLLDVDDLPPAVHDRILERAEGNPFFLEEIVRQLIDEGSIERAGVRWRATSRIEDVEIPDTVQGVLAARIDLLEPSDKRTLQLAAVVGRVFWPGSVRVLLNGDADSLGASLERLRSRDLVLTRVGSTVAGEEEFLFKHVLTRDVAYETLPRRDRARAHAAVATWIEDSAKGRVREFGELLAHHYAEAYEAERGTGQRDPERAEQLRRRAFEALVAAAAEARRRSAVEAAFGLCDRALSIATDPIERAEALETRGATALTDYRGDLAWASFREAADLRIEHAGDDHDAIAYACARAIESPTRWPGSMTSWPDDEIVIGYLETGLHHAGDEPSEALVRLLTSKAFLPFGLSHPGPDAWGREHELAVEAGHRAAELALELGRPDLASAALDGASSAAIDLGLFGRSWTTTQRRLALIPSIDDPWELGDTFAMAAWETSMIGDAREALRHAEAGLELVDRQGAEGLVLHNVAWASFSEFLLGEWDSVVERRLALARQLLGERADRPPYFAQSAYGSAAFVHAVRDEADQLEPLRPVLTFLTGQSSTSHGGGAPRTWVAWIEVREERYDSALEVLDSARILPTQTHRPLVEVVAADLLAGSRRWDEVPAYLEETRAYAKRAGLLALPAHMDRLEAQHRRATQDPASAVRLLERATAAFDKLEHRWEAARTRLLLAEMHAAADRGGEARHAIDGCLPVLERLRSVRELERARSLSASLS